MHVNAGVMLCSQHQIDGQKKDMIHSPEASDAAAVAEESLLIVIGTNSENFAINFLDGWRILTRRPNLGCCETKIICILRERDLQKSM